MHIQFATAANHPTLTDDDRIAVDALEQRGIRVEPVIWSESLLSLPHAGSQGRSADGDRCVAPHAVVIRSCWDYHLREREFSNWIERLEQQGVTVINAPDLVRWNLHKGYIKDLESRGVPVVPTIWVKPDDPRSLRDHIDGSGWQQVVVKPAVSLSAYETWRVDVHEAEALDSRFARLRSRGDVLVQRFIPEITGDGEWSLIFFGTEFSHAVRKRPKTGDFRVQTEHGGSAVSEAAPPSLVDDAARVIRSLPEAPVYVRVDGVSVDGVFLLMEVECIDPFLFFEGHGEAAGRFADEVVRHLA